LRVEPPAKTVLRALLLLMVSAALLHSADDRHLTIYMPRGSFAVPVHENDTVVLADVVSSMAPTSLEVSKKKIVLHVGNRHGEFHEGASDASVGRSTIDLGGAAHLKDGELLVPMRCLGALIPVLTGEKAEFHEGSRRLFVGGAAMRYSAELIKNGGADSLVLNFPAPVSPMVSTEGNTLRLTFAHDPVVSNGRDKQPLAGKLFSELDYSEHDNAADIIVLGNAPLQAIFSENGRRATVSGAAAPQKNTPLAAAAPSAPAPSPSINAVAAITPAARPPIGGTVSGTVAPRWFVMIDAAHGGDDAGVRLSDNLLEKDVVLGLAHRLRADLESRGIASVLLRDADTDTSDDQRAVTTNTQRAAVYIALHAGRPGSGVRVFTEMMPIAPNAPAAGAFIEWQQAQAPFLERSRELAMDVVSEMGAKSIPARELPAALPPMNAINAPAIAVELAPADADDIDSITSAPYQEIVSAAIAKAVVRIKAQSTGGQR